MAKESGANSAVTILAELVHYLHQGVAAEEFFAQIARVNDLSIPASERSSLIECVRMAMAVRNRLELHQQREHGLLAVIESAQDLSSRLDQTELLRAIVTRARNLLGAHVAWISVYNPELDLMQVQVADGAIFGETQRMTTKKNLGVASIVFATRMPFATSDYLSDERFPHDPKLDVIFSNEGLDGLVGVPLLLENEVTGMLFVADRYHRSYSALEVSILSTLATHAAVAINNAKAFDVTKKALQRGDIVRAELELRARNVQSASEAHEQLIALLAQGASLSALCNKLAQMLNARILLLDEALQTICRGYAVSDDDSLAKFEKDGEHGSAIENAVRGSRKDGRSVIAYNADGVVCRVVPVIGGTEFVGSALLFSKDDADELSIHIFEHSASIIGIFLLSQERQEIHRTRDATALIKGLLLPHQYEWASTLERANQFGFNLSQPLSLLLIEFDALKASYVVKRLRAITSVSSVVLDEIDNVVAIVCRTQKAQDLAQTCTRLMVRQLKIDYLGVLSRPAPGAEKISAIYASLRRALFVARRLGAKGILSQHELTLYSVLFETQDEASIDEFLESSIGLLLAYDRKKGSELADTLLCYFDSNRNAKLVAKRMDIHVNTVHQRLTHIENMLGHLGNPTRALELHMSLRLWALSRRNGALTYQASAGDENL